MEKIDQKNYQILVKNMAQLLSLSKLYNTEHLVFRERLAETVKQVKYLTSNNTSLVMSGMEGILFVNGQKIDLKNRLMERFAESLSVLKIGSVDIEPDFLPEDIIALINILNQKEHYRGVDEIKKHWRDKNITHIIPQFAFYKLVKEDEKIVNEKGTMNVSDLPQEVISKYSQNLQDGNVLKLFKEGDLKYKAIAHDPVFLSGFVYDFAEKANTVEELEKVLWLIGDYLISEISTAKEEEINRKLLEEFKIKLISLWEKKKDEKWHGAIHKNIMTISAALELKGMMLVYKKHRKGAERALKKIWSILETLPQESQLYKKTVEEIK